MALMHSLALKRLFDISIALAAFMLLWPVFLAIALLVWLMIGWPILFRQVRPGLNTQPFTLYKFRTMTDARDADGKPLLDADRLTSLGRFLRRSSLDELPELINMLRGEMSLVGPRPLLARYLPYYTKCEAKRFDVRPGITGWAQINGRNATSWDRRLELDVWYVEHWSFWLDVKILSITVWKVFSREGVIVDPGSAMPDLDKERAAMRQEKV